MLPALRPIFAQQPTMQRWGRRCPPHSGPHWCAGPRRPALLSRPSPRCKAGPAAVLHIAVIVSGQDLGALLCSVGSAHDAKLGCRRPPHSGRRWCPGPERTLACLAWAAAEHKSTSNGSALAGAAPVTMKEPIAQQQQLYTTWCYLPLVILSAILHRCVSHSQTPGLTQTNRVYTNDHTTQLTNNTCMHQPTGDTGMT